MFNVVCTVLRECFARSCGMQGILPGECYIFVSAYNRCSERFFVVDVVGWILCVIFGKIRVNRLMVAPIVFNITGLLLNDMNRKIWFVKFEINMFLCTNFHQIDVWKCQILCILGDFFNINCVEVSVQVRSVFSVRESCVKLISLSVCR